MSSDFVLFFCYAACMHKVLRPNLHFGLKRFLSLFSFCFWTSSSASCGPLNPKSHFFSVSTFFAGCFAWCLASATLVLACFSTTACLATALFLCSFSSVSSSQVVLICWNLTVQWEILKPQKKCVLVRVSAISNKPVMRHCALRFQ